MRGAWLQPEHGDDRHRCKPPWSHRLYDDSEMVFLKFGVPRWLIPHRSAWRCDCGKAWVLRRGYTDEWRRIAHRDVDPAVIDIRSKDRRWKEIGA